MSEYGKKDWDAAREVIAAHPSPEGAQYLARRSVDLQYPPQPYYKKEDHLKRDLVLSGLALAGVLGLGAGLAATHPNKHSSHPAKPSGTPIEKPGGHQTGVDSATHLKQAAQERGVSFARK